MEVKGTAVIPSAIFVKEKFGSRYDEWLNSLSKPSSDIVKNATTLGWYPFKEAVVEPTQKICDLFYGGKEAGAVEVGRFSADHGLNRIYKVFVKLGSPQFIITKASDIMSNYYKGCTMKVVESTKTSAVAQISDFPEMHRLAELRIVGWIERALEINGAKNIKLTVSKSVSKGDAVSELSATWD